MRAMRAETDETTARASDDARAVSFWREQIQNYDASAKASTRGMIARLDRDDPLGVDLTLRGASTRQGRGNG